MGFNLEMFFDELIEIIDSDMKIHKKWNVLCRAIMNGYKYAKECGHLKK